jgi:hypothetical protein
MTDLVKGLKRVTGAKDRGVPLVARMTPFDVTLTPLGSRSGYTVPWAAIYDLGGKLAAREQERERRDKASR